MSSKKDDPNGFDEFDMPEPGHELHGRPVHGHSATSFGEDEFGGPEPFDFENAPEAPLPRRGPVHHGLDGFDDIHEEDAAHGIHVDEHGVEHEHDHDSAYTDEGHVEHLETQEGAVAPKSKSSKLIYPVGGAVLLGALGLGAWHMGVFGGSPHYVAPMPSQAPMMPRGPGPHLVAPNNGTIHDNTSAPLLPPPGPATLPPAGVGPGSLPTMPSASMHSDTIQPMLPIGTTRGGVPPVQEPLSGGMHAPALSDAGMGQKGDPQSSISTLVDITSKLKDEVSTRFDKTDAKLDKTDEALIGRFDKTDAKIEELGGHINSMETQVDSVEKRLSAMESGANAVRPRVQEAAPRAVRGSRVHRHGHAAARVHSEASHGGHGMEDYTLRAVSSGTGPTTAWVKTPAGFVLVKEGQSMEGAGVVQTIRKAGGSWEMVTSNGVIRP